MLALALAIALSSCSATDVRTETVPADGSSLAVWLEFFEARGDLDGVSAEQRTVLEAAAEKDVLTYEELAGLIQLTFACVEAQGLRATWLDPRTDYGYPVPDYGITESATLGSDASLAVIDNCTNRYSGLAEQLYVWQPVNAAIEAKLWDREKRAPMIECLRNNGVAIDDDATRQEIEVAAVILSQATGPKDDPVFGPDCFVD